MTILNILSLGELVSKQQIIRKGDYHSAILFFSFDDIISSPIVADKQKLIAYLNAIRNLDEKLEIDFRDCSFSDQISEIVQVMLSNNSHIKKLVLWFPANRITDEGCDQILESVEKLQDLENFILNLEWNFDITVRTYNRVIETIKYLPKIKSLDIKISKHTFISEDLIDDFKKNVFQKLKIKKARFNNVQVIQFN